MRADLHLHSVWSDGLHTPAQLAAMAKAAGLGLFSVTDHDNMGGSGEAADAAKRIGLHCVRGWEISAYEGDAKVHVLGYGCNMGEAYEAFLRDRRDDALERAKRGIALANGFLGLDVTLEEAERFHPQKDAPMHTMHVVRAFARRLNRDEGEVYREVFAFGGPAFTRLRRPTPEEAVKVIATLGGVSVLAHPGRIADFTPEEFRLFRETDDSAVKKELLSRSNARRFALTERLVACGLGGIECYYTTHTEAETEYFLGYAKERGLLVTGGSDFHGEDGVHAVGKPHYNADAAWERLLCLDGSV